jgi:hypothetical protein
MISAEQIVSFEVCPRRYFWNMKYENLRIGLVRALYLALNVGLLAEKPEQAAENKYLKLAANPGLDIEGPTVYACAMHYAKLAGIVAAALRSTTSSPWTLIPATDKWESACYDMGDGKPRRIVLVDRWSDTRKQEEIYSWRTMGEACALNQTVYITAVIIGASQDKHRHSAWTRCFRHPTNFTLRFQRKDREKFSAEWMTQWREDAGVPTDDWLAQMHKDGCMTDLVHTTMVPVPIRKDSYLEEMERLSEEIVRKRETPPMRLAGCFGFNPCPFISVCHGAQPAQPFRYGFQARKSRAETIISARTP